MLTGNPPHTGASAQQSIMKIIATPAEAVTVYRKSVPANVAAAVVKSLEKLPADRFESAKAFAEALANPAYGHGSGATVIAGAGVVSPRRRRATVLAWALTACAIGAAGGGRLDAAPTARAAGRSFPGAARPGPAAAGRFGGADRAVSRW